MRLLLIFLCMTAFVAANQYEDIHRVREILDILFTYVDGYKTGEYMTRAYWLSEYFRSAKLIRNRMEKDYEKVLNEITPIVARINVTSQSVEEVLNPKRYTILNYFKSEFGDEIETVIKEALFPDDSIRSFLNHHSEADNKEYFNRFMKIHSALLLKIEKGEKPKDVAEIEDYKIREEAFRDIYFSLSNISTYVNGFYKMDWRDYLVHHQTTTLHVKLQKFLKETYGPSLGQLRGTIKKSHWTDKWLLVNEIKSLHLKVFDELYSNVGEPEHEFFESFKNFVYPQHVERYFTILTEWLSAEDLEKYKERFLFVNEIVLTKYAASHGLKV